MEILGSKITHQRILVTPMENDLKFIQVIKIYTNRDFKRLTIGYLLECSLEYHFQFYELVTSSSTRRVIKFEDVHNYFNTYKVKLNSNFYIVRKWF